MTPAVVDFTKCPNLGASIAWASTQPGAEGFTELLRATAAGRIALTAIMHRKARWSPHDLTSRLPTVVLIGDDKGNSRDPADWRCSMAAIAWARAAIVHGCGAERWHYGEAIKAAEVTGRCLFVETDSDHVAAWVSAIAPRNIPPGLSIIPREGQKHPIPAGASGGHA
jgi:hypothetical protein